MAKITAEFKETIASISRKELEKLVLKAATKDKEFYNFIFINFVDKEFGENELFEKAINDIDVLMNKGYKGYSEELQLANMLAACNKRIDEFGKVCKNKSLVIDLIIKVLEVPFSLSSNMFTTCFTNYNYRVFILLKKAISILENKLHEDYQIQYEHTLNTYLEIFHRTSSHLDYVYGFQKKVKHSTFKN